MRVNTEKNQVVKNNVFLFIQKTDNSGNITQSDFHSTKHKKGKIASLEEFKHYLKLKETQNITFAQYYEQLLRNELNQPKCNIEKLMQIDSEQEKYDIQYEYNILIKWMQEFANLDLESLSFITKVNQNIKYIVSEYNVFIRSLRPYIYIDLIIDFLLQDSPKFISKYVEWAENLHPNDEIKLTEKIFPILDYLGNTSNEKRYKYLEETIFKISNLKLSNHILLPLLKRNRDGILSFIKRFKPDFITSSLKMIQDELNFDDPYYNTRAIKNIELLTNYAQRSRSFIEYKKKNVFNYILELNLPIEVLKQLPNLVVFYLKNYPDYFSRLISKIKEKYEDIFDFFKQDIRYYLEILYSLKEKNKDLDELISKIPAKAYFSYWSWEVLDRLLFRHPDTYIEISVILKTYIFEYLTEGYPVLWLMVKREPTYIKEFLTELEKKFLNVNGKRYEKEFLNVIELLIGHIWDCLENFMSNEDRLIIEEIKNYYPSPSRLIDNIDPKYKTLFYPQKL